MPKISVLLPARNAARWVDRALASILSQTERDLEVVAVDDGSTDATSAHLERAARRDRRVVVVRTPHAGLPAALETARAHARGAYLARQDADDVSHPRRLELELARLRAVPGPAAVGACVSLFPAARVGAGMARWAAWHNALRTHEEMARDALVDSVLCHGTLFLRAETAAGAGGWRERGWPEDVDLWLRLLARGVRFAKCPERLYGWRQHPGSSTHTDPRYGPARFRALRVFGLSLGLLADAPRSCTLVGVGRSLALWREALTEAHGPALRVRAVEARRPTADVLGRLAPPLVLVYGARRARERFRAALAARGLVEGTDFVFVA